MGLNWLLVLTKKSLSCTLSVSSLNSSASLAAVDSRLELVVMLGLVMALFPHCEKDISFTCCSNFSTLLLSANASSSVSCCFWCLTLVWSSFNMHSIFSIWSACSLESFNLRIKKFAGESDFKPFSIKLRLSVYLRSDRRSFSVWTLCSSVCRFMMALSKLNVFCLGWSCVCFWEGKIIHYTETNSIQHNGWAKIKE